MANRSWKAFSSWGGPLIRTAAIAVTTVTILGAIWWVPKVEVDPWRTRLSAQEQLEAEDALRRTVAQVVGGVFLAVGLFFTWQNVVIAREGKITDRFGGAVEQLGSDKLAVRIGGIHALERIDRDSKRDHWTIAEVLCAFIRENGPPATGKRLADTQAACTVIGRRSWRWTEESPLNLTFGHLAGIELGGAQLARANLHYANLSNAFLVGADLTGATLLGANLEDAFLTQANLRGANLEGANLRGAHLDIANLREANLKGTILEAAHLEGSFVMSATGLTGEQIETAHTDAHTRLPPAIVEVLATNRSERALSREAQARQEAPPDP